MVSSKLLAMLNMALLAHATPSFQNEGTKDSWDKIFEEHNGVVSEDSSIFYDTAPSLYMLQTYDQSYTGRYHSEAIKNRGYTGIGETTFYGFAFRLAKDWDFSGDQSYNIAQFIADFGDADGNDCGEDWLPSIMVWLVGDKLQTRLKTGSVCSTKYTKIADIATVTEGEWHKIVMDVSWQSDASGHYRMWYDGEQVVSKEGTPTTYEDNNSDREFDFRVGLYANGWHDQSTLVGNGTREIWLDKVGIGSAMEDADPDLWGSVASEEDDEDACEQ